MNASPDAPWHRLEPLPRPLWLPSLVASVGPADRRLADVQRWRDALAHGALPQPDADFGDAAASAPLRAACEDLGLAALCRGAPAMAEQLLRTLLWHLDRIVDHQPRLTRPEAIAQVADEFRAAWTLEKGDWDQLLALLQGLGDLAKLRWDALKGHLTSREWREAQRISERLAQLPELADLVRRLGRSHHAPARPRPAPRPEDAAVKRLLGLRPVEIRLPHAPGEVKGIRHTDQLERLLGSEAAMIRHPVLRKLWRARRAEGRLLGYDSEAVLVDLRPDPRAAPRPLTAPPVAETLERGPIVLCLDTSGSMRGAPENIAKAVALEAFRTAHREGRACKLIAFGGPDEMLERDLDLSARGLGALLALMGQAFDGGTDIQGPIERALEAVHQARWNSADLLVVSDGEFGCTPATLARLDEAREALGLREQGDDIFWVRDWRRHGDAVDSAQRQGYSPVHSKSLTALYFPNALSGRAARHRPGG